MPTPIRVNQNQTKAVTPPKTSVLDRIKKLEERNLGLKFSVYGSPKSGKTRFACTFPKPLLIVGFEDGTESVVGSEDIDFVLLENTNEFDTLLNGPIKGGNYKTVVVDNATRMRDLRLCEIAGYKEVPVQKGFGMYNWDQYREVAGALKLMLGKLCDVHKQGVNVVIIAQEANIISDDGKPSDLIKPCVASALGKGLCDFVNAECDYIGQMCKKEETKRVEQKVGNKTMTIEQPTGKIEYALRVGPHPVYYTGFRQHIGTPELPDFITPPTYDKVMEVIRGKK